MRSPAAFLAVAVFLWPGLYVRVASAEPTPIPQCDMGPNQRVIVHPGLYVLVDNLHASGDCLVVTMDSVTIDLAGFVITGAGTGDGIRADPTFQNIAVRNGTITGFDTGINLSDTPAPVGALRNSSIIEGVRVYRNRIGLIAAGIVTGNIAIMNSEYGIIASGRVGDNVAAQNGNIANQGSRGFLITFGPSVASGAVSGSSVVSSNSAVDNGFIGMEVRGGGSTVIGNVAAGSGDVGMLADCRPPRDPMGTSSVITANTVVNNRPPNLLLSGGFCIGTNATSP